MTSGIMRSRCLRGMYYVFVGCIPERKLRPDALVEVDEIKFVIH